MPVHEYAHPQDAPCASVTGGTVYRGSIADWQGVYFFADYCFGSIWGLRRSAGVWEFSGLLDTVLSIASFGEDETGELYVVGLETNGVGGSVGVVYRLARSYATYIPSLLNSDR